MDYSCKDELASPTMENRYYNRKTAASRSLFPVPKRRIPMTPYVPPYRRKSSTEEDLLTSKRSAKSTAMITQEIDRNSVILQEINQDNNDCFDQEEFIPKFKRRENIVQNINRMSAVERVLKLAKNYMNFEFKEILQEIYFRNYKENLPSECLSAIKFSVSLELNDSINDLLNAESHFEESNRTRRFSMDKRGRSDKEDRPLFYKKQLTKPKALELKDINEEFWAYIYHCQSFTSIRGVILDADHFEKVEELAEQMKTFYQFEKLQKVTIEVNGYYAVFDGSWHRVQCLQCNESTATVFFIDRGDQDMVPVDKLIKLDPRFFELESQAINMSLSGLEIFADCNETHEILDEILFEKMVFVTHLKNSNEEKNHLSVTLYINNDNENVNVNELMANRLFKTVLNPLSHIRKDFAEHIEFIKINETGLFIQISTISLKYFELLMKVLDEKYHSEGNFKKQKVVRFEAYKTYIIRINRENKFYRAKVLQFKDENVIEVLLIDIGVVTYIDREDFFSLEKLSNILAQYPAQAIEVQLYKITVLHSKVLDHLHAITSNSKELYVKFMQSEEENNSIPVIRLYKKVHGHLMSINDALLVEHSDIIECEEKISKSKAAASHKDTIDENKPNSNQFNCNKSKSISVRSNFNVDKQKLVEENFDETSLESIMTENRSNFKVNKPKLAEENFDNRIPKLVKGNYQSKLKLNEANFDENDQKSSESNFDENKQKSGESNFDENKQKSGESNFYENKQKSGESNFYENKQKSSENNFWESKQKSIESNFYENQKTSEDNFYENKHIAEENIEDLFKNNLSSQLERLKLFQAELTPVVDRIDCTKFNISTLLNPPKVPKNSYFDVHVTIAKNPSYFVIQLLKSKSINLKKLMQEMNEVALDYRGPKLTYKSICVGQMYAYRCESNPEKWYRVYLLRIKDKNVATAYYCDYGHYTDIRIENLICMQNKFYSLPYQAIWADLYGVKPVSGHWSERESSRFRELVESKNFVCCVKSIKDVKELNSRKEVPVTVETIYVVKLIDTSTNEDVYISDILINEGQALRKENNCFNF